MNKKIIVADAGPLIAFAKIQRLDLLKKVLGQIIAPQAVIDECLVNPKLQGAAEITDALKGGLIRQYENLQGEKEKFLFENLGQGEASAILLALQLHSKLLIDERIGRRVAKQKNISIIGTAGVLLLAKEKKLIPKVASLIYELKNVGYRLSEDLVNTILIRAKE
ncbi:Domain of uncharacterised function (DUF3368) (plasmid) [Legionella adelaidensis]|uniref:Domain of uncharacterized function (DUF3368) n=1 Tax=Legionella adelaidensis TaxID=45056 RepID=A0A0W0R390_9GAMM|nr:DUF3368 domain-containing protein [Legionella adelaidensis]KTC65533.1 hypothetical protein Lade_0191 [Legionella adelaidensis]VEH84646.1 Domain of uncharacterised function (DUF3368) [Legionella adelaidensis]